MLEIIFICILGVLTYTDLKDRRIPNYLLVAAIVAKLVFFMREEGFAIAGLLGMLGNGLVVSLPLWLLTMLMDKFFKKRTMGGGDIKLIFVTGVYLGWEKNLLMLFLAGLLGLIFGAVRKEREIPFGPAIAVSTTLVLIFGNIL